MSAPETSGPGAPFGLARMKTGLARSASRLRERAGGIFGRRALDAAALEELRDALIEADLGPDAAARMIGALERSHARASAPPEHPANALAALIAAELAPVAQPLRIDPAQRPHVILVVGANGSGKTTTIGKLAGQYGRAGMAVHLAACDTFRAAAVEQLQAWGERAGAVVETTRAGGDAAGLAHDALARAREAGAGLLLIDTAGRLHNKADLMAELAKIIRVLRKIDPALPHDTLLVLDAGVGRNAVAQVETFSGIAAVSGLAMTKLDGTARGGILVEVAGRFGLPVHLVGIGEGVDDLAPLDPDAFARALTGAA